jgi:UDP-N-acetylglucosamine acyltransferase
MPGSIHPTAIVDPQARIDPSATIGAYTVIGPEVKIGAGTSVGAHCVIEGRTTIGRDNRIFQFNSRSPGGGGITRVGNDNWLMAYVHLAHDCQVGNHTIFANNAQLAGHVEVGDWVILGGFTVVHQFVRIGAHGMTALSSVLLADQPPFVMSQGQPARARSMNFEGLRRRGFSAGRISAVKAMHKALYRDDLTLAQARTRIAEISERAPEANPDVALMLSFLDEVSAERGIVR